MLKGTQTIYVNLTIGDEYGIYRTGENGSGYLLFAFSERVEALRIGADIADLLNIPFNNRLPVEDKKDQTAGWCNVIKKLGAEQRGESLVQQNTIVAHKPKTIQVRGIAADVKLYIKDYTEAAIIEKLLPRYLAVGRTEADGRYNIKYYIKECLKEKVK